MTLIRQYIIILTILTVAFSSWGQDVWEPVSFEFNIKDGLPSNTVYDIIQDSRGYIWIGTENGIAKFDGREFETLNDQHLDVNEISYLYEVPDGSIWAVTFGNRIIRIENDSIHIVKAFEPFHNDRKYFSMIHPRDSLLFVKSKDNLIKYNLLTEDIHPIPHIVKPGFINHITHNQDSVIILVHSKGADKRKKSIIHTYDIDSGTLGIIDVKLPALVTNVYQHQDQTLLMGIKMGINMIQDGQSALWDRIPEMDATDRLLNLSDIDEDIWVNTFKGSIRLSDRQRILSKKTSTKVIKDFEGSHWVSTYNSGIFHIPNFHLVQHKEFSQAINRIVSSDQFLFLGMSDGQLVHYDPTHDSIVKQLNMENFKDIKDMNYNPHLQRIFINNRHTFQYDIRDKKISKLPLTSSATLGLSSNQNFLLDLNNVVILVHFFDEPGNPSSTISEEWKKNISESFSFNNKEIIYNTENILAHTDNNIWFLMNDKILVKKEFGLDSILYQGKNLIGLDACQMSDDSVVISNHDYGLSFIVDYKAHKPIQNPDINRFGRIDKIKYKNDYIVGLTRFGMLIMDRNGKILKTIDESDGLDASIVNDFAIWNHYLFAATTQGLYKIDLKLFSDNETASKTYINEIRMNGEVVSESHSFKNGSNVEISFNHTGMKGRKNSRIQFRMNENEAWKPVSNNSINLPNLSPGSYNFQVRTINEEGIIGEPTSYAFYIRPPIWQRWWFILGACFLLALVLFIFYKRRLSAIEKENQYEQEIRSNKLSALRSRMNPHFIFNSLNSIQDFIIKMDKLGANEYLGIFSDLMRIYLRHSELNRVELHEEIEALELYLKLEELRFGDIETHFHIDPKLEQMDLFIPPLFIQPYIENAFKHGLLHKREGDKKLEIIFRYLENDKTLLIEITDNGIGQEESLRIKQRSNVKGLSFSTKANQTRLELLNHNRIQKISVEFTDLNENGKASGTKVTILVPDTV